MADNQTTTDPNVLWASLQEIGAELRPYLAGGNAAAGWVRRLRAALDEAHEEVTILCRKAEGEGE